MNRLTVSFILRVTIAVLVAGILFQLGIGAWVSWQKAETAARIETVSGASLQIDRKSTR